MTKKELRQWLAAVKQCEKQDSYGDSNDCELCKLREEMNKDCCECICFEYAVNNNIKIIPMYICSGLYAAELMEEPHYVYHWDADICRRVLAKIREWIEGQL